MSIWSAQIKVYVTDGTGLVHASLVMMARHVSVLPVQEKVVNYVVVMELV